MIATTWSESKPEELLLIIVCTSSLSINLETVLPPRVKLPSMVAFSDTVKLCLILKSLVAI